MNKAIEGFNWEQSFRGKDIGAQARIFNETVTKICYNYIPNKYAKFKDKNLPWLNSRTKPLIKKKKITFQKHVKG